MICPTCGTHIPDGSLRCPACHAGVAYTVAMEPLRGRWCPSCGVGLGWDDEVCPSCGLPLENSWGAPQKPASDEAAEADETGALSLERMEAQEQETRAMARIESAVPPEHDPESKVAEQEVMPRTRAVVLASFASLALVGGLALAITHPWAPSNNSIKATKEADTSMAGFPGTVESLTGQDSNGSPSNQLTGDEATFALLSDAYGKLARYAARADENLATYQEVAFSDDVDARAQGKRDIDALAIDVSNLVSQIAAIDVTSGTYEQEREHLSTLASWLRNRIDTMAAAWKAVYESADPAAERERLAALMAKDDNPDGVNGYKALFDESYASWEPKQQ